MAYKKLSRLLAELVEHPREGTGHSDPLTVDDLAIYSRQISASDRLIYDIHDGIAFVLVFPSRVTTGINSRVYPPKASPRVTYFKPPSRNFHT
ncbi:MAG: type II toxin-antitoxin system YoeB family toxin [Prevotellaceae bacterium]|nr:type II toxin-antitoxin system YoeB family toxin [Prevotellaceae bacterium]